MRLVNTVAVFARRTVLVLRKMFRVPQNIINCWRTKEVLMSRVVLVVVFISAGLLLKTWQKHRSIQIVGRPG
jgi:hypothetical protein